MLDSYCSMSRGYVITWSMTTPSAWEIARPYTALMPKLEEIARAGVGMLRGWRAWEDLTRTTITVRPQTKDRLRIRRLVLSSAEAGNWVIHDIKIGNRGQLATAPGQGVPAAAFLGPDANLNFTDLESGAGAGRGVEIAVVVEYVGDDPRGAVFRAVFICDREPGGRTSLPISSAVPIRAVTHEGRRVAIQIDDRVLVFVEDRAKKRVLIRDATELWVPISDTTDAHRFELVLCDGNNETMTGDDDLYLEHQRRAPVWSDGAESMMGDNGVDVERVRRVGPGILRPVRPIPVSLHTLEVPGPVLFGIDERTGKVVFEVGVRDPHAEAVFGEVFATPNASADERSAAWSESINRVLRTGLYSELNRDGYEPTWWKMAQVLGQDLLDPANDPGAIGSAG